MQVWGIPAGMTAPEALAAISQSLTAQSSATAQLEQDIRNARRAGCSWQQVGDALGISRQGAWSKWSYVDTQREGGRNNGKS